MKLLFDYLYVCDHNPPTLRTGGQTNGRTDSDTFTRSFACYKFVNYLYLLTYDSNTALCVAWCGKNGPIYVKPIPKIRAGLWLCGALGQKYFVGAPSHISIQSSHKPVFQGNKMATYIKQSSYFKIFT